MKKGRKKGLHGRPFCTFKKKRKEGKERVEDHITQSVVVQSILHYKKAEILSHAKSSLYYLDTGYFSHAVCPHMIALSKFNKTAGGKRFLINWIRF